MGGTVFISSLVLEGRGMHGTPKKGKEVNLSGKILV